MNCQKICHLLSPYQDNECDEETRSKIISHLQKCKRCRREYEKLEFIKKKITRLPKIEPESHLTANIMSKLVQKKEARLLPLPSVIYSIIFIIFFIMGVLINQDMEPQREEMTISQLLLQGQDLNMLLMEENPFYLLKNGGNNEN
jgi:predicted anti-sigma-YlaC factor YlaD